MIFCFCFCFIIVFVFFDGFLGIGGMLIWFLLVFGGEGDGRGDGCYTLVPGKAPLLLSTTMAFSREM